MLVFEKSYTLPCIALILCIASVLSYDVNLEIEELRAMYGDHVPYMPIKSEGTVDKRFLFGSSTYCHEKLGCFPMNGDFSERPVGLKPNTRNIVNTKFTLYTRRNQNNGQKLTADDTNTLSRSLFDGNRKTKFIIHGFIESTSASWFQLMNKQFLKNGDYNVINVDWGSLGGSKTLYTQATANTRVVAREIVYLIKTLQQTKGLNTDNVHLIGHSLGSHIAGYVGKNLTGSINRISGLDPAEPYFQGYNKGIRLDPSDAKYVDVIHSDADSILEAVKGNGGFGTNELSGHADFFPNGGETQPNCKNGIITNVRLENDLYEGLKRFVACDHDRAVKYYTESINDCPFTGVLCSSYVDYEQGKCSVNCKQQDQCNSMGFQSRKPTSRGYKRYYLHTTGNDDNFCANGYLIKVKIEGSSSELPGTLDITVTGNTGKKQVFNFNKDSLALKAGQTYTYQVGLSTALGEPIGLEVVWTYSSSWWNVVSKACGYIGLCNNAIKIEEIELTNNSGKSYYFCGMERSYRSKVSRYLFSRSSSCVGSSMLVGR